MQPPNQPYYPPSSKPRRKPDLIGLLIIASLILLALFVCVFPALGIQTGAFFRVFEPSCLDGVQGSSVVITVQSWNAGSDCNTLAYSRENWSSSDFVGFGLYPVSSADTSGTVQCETDVSGRHVIVRSGEASLLAAKVVCDKLHGLPY